MSQKGLVGFYSLKFNNYNPISQLRLSDFPYSESNLDASKVHGIAATAGTTIDVTLEFGIHTGLSGLTTGSTYYVIDDGTLATAPDSKNAKLGVAINATSLALDFTDELTSADLGTYATKAYVATQVANLVNSAPTTLDTLNELAAALGDDANFSTTVTNSLANKLEASDLNGYATETYVQNYVANNSSSSTVTEVSSPNVSLDLNNTYFKLDMTADTTISTTNHPASGEVYEGKLLVTGNEDINAFNLFSNPDNAISGWRTSVTYSGATDFSPAANIYSFGCVSWDGVYMVLGAYTTTSTYKIQVIQMSTPFDPSTGTKVRSETNVHTSLGSSLNIRGGAKFLSDNVTVHIGGVNKYYNVTNGAISSASGTVPIQQSWSRGTWANNGTLYYVAQKTQNESPKVWKYTNNGTPYSFSSLSLSQTVTLTPQWSYNLTGTGSNRNPSSSTQDQYMSILVSDDGTKVALLGQIEPNNYNIYPMRYTMSTPHNLSTMSPDTSLTYNIPLGNAGVHSQWLDGGRYLYTGGTTIIKNLATTAVNNTLTWPQNFNFFTEGDDASPGENQVKIYEFSTIDGGVTFYASTKK